MPGTVDWLPAALSGAALTKSVAALQVADLANTVDIYAGNQLIMRNAQTNMFCRWAILLPASSSSVPMVFQGCHSSCHNRSPDTAPARPRRVFALSITRDGLLCDMTDFNQATALTFTGGILLLVTRWHLELPPAAP
jgi:hypothetical protein